MKNKRVLRVGIVLVAGIFAGTTRVSAQSSTMRTKTLQRLLQASNKLSQNQKALLSSGMRNLLREAQRELSGAPGSTSAPSKTVPATASLVQTTTTTTNGTIIVSNPKLDFSRSVLGGFTQSTTSSARCGNSVVVGFGDVEDVRTPPFTTVGELSLDGVAISADGGQTFSDRGYIGYATVPANEEAVLGGDPVLACSSANRFYYASLLEIVTFDQSDCSPGCPNEGVSVSISDNGGKTWADPVQAVLVSGFDHTIDKPWLAVDPSNPRRLYVTYTDFPAASGFNACVSGESLIKLVSSADGGSTWSAPVVIQDECPDQSTGNGNMVTGSNVVVSPDGKVFVAYELFSLMGSSFPQILLQRSLDHGQTFSKPVKVSDVVPSGPGLFRRLLQTLIETDEFPMLAVDRSTGASRGTLYVAWPDGRDNIVPDVISGAYSYADIYVAKSTDSGSSFTVLPPISPTPPTFRGRGRDQFLPGIAVDKDGEVAVCYYDRRNDPTNMAIDRYCSVSFNQGLSWQDLRASSPGWVPLNAEPLLYVFDDMAGIPFEQIFATVDYDTVTSDFLQVNDGFFGAFIFQVDGNQNIVAKEF